MWLEASLQECRRSINKLSCRNHSSFLCMLLGILGEILDNWISVNMNYCLSSTILPGFFPSVAYFWLVRELGVIDGIFCIFFRVKEMFCTLSTNNIYYKQKYHGMTFLTIWMNINNWSNMHAIMLILLMKVKKKKVSLCEGSLRM